MGSYWGVHYFYSVDGFRDTHFGLRLSFASTSQRPCKADRLTLGPPVLFSTSQWGRGPIGVLTATTAHRNLAGSVFTCLKPCFLLISDQNFMCSTTTVNFTVCSFLLSFSFTLISLGKFLIPLPGYFCCCNIVGW